MRHKDGAPEISADFQQQFQRFAHLLGVPFDVGIEQRFSHDLQRQPHHLLMGVAFFPAPPAMQHPLRVLHHRGRIRSDSRAVKRRLRQPPLPQPEFSFAGQQAFAKDVPVRPQHPAFRISARVGDQHFFDQAGMVDENRLEIQNAHPRDVAILARDLGEIFQRIVIERPERPSFEPLGGAGGKFAAARAPHPMMLCPRSRCVNAAGVLSPHISRARTARIRKPPHRKSTVTSENPVVVNLAIADAGVTGTNVLRMCPTLCSHPS